MKIEEEICISDLETLKVISDPLRVQILERIGLACDSGKLTTVKQLSDDLDIPPTKLYYHIKLLEKHELIRVAETRMVSGIIEKHYQICARRIRASLDISKNTNIDRDEGIVLTLASITTMLDTAYKNVEKSFQHRLKEGSSDDDETGIMLSSQAMMQLSSEQAEEFIEKLNDLVDQYENVNHPDGLTFGLTVLFNPNFHVVPPKKEGEMFPSGDFREPLKEMENTSFRIPPQL